MNEMTTQQQAPGAPGDATAGQRAARVLGQALVAVYAILALAATARSGYQIVAKFGDAPVAYLLSAFSGVVYIVATVALALHRRPAMRILAWITISVEMAGVLVVGLLSLLDPALAGAGAAGDHATVWSYFGMGYAFVPLVLPVLGLVYLGLTRRSDALARAEGEGSGAGLL